MARINNEDINRVRQSANITEVIAQYLAVEKKGRNFVALCPFHEDSDPSLTISEDKQIYKCFACGAGGNVFTFISKYKNVSFVQSVKEVADLVNIKLDIQDVKENYPVETEFDKYYKMMEDANSFMHFKLMNTQDKMINDYIKERKLREKDLVYFDVGYESEHSLTDFLSKKGYNTNDLVSINLLNDYDYGLRSVFNNRLVFPIHNEYKRIVGNSARTLVDDKDTAKYINSNENIIYTKGNVLYNFHRASESAKQLGHVYLVEGVMDVVGYYQADVLNVVASLGTALTEPQAKLLKKLSNHVILSFDGDNAGLAATVKAIDILLKEKFTIEILTGFDNLDPDDYLQTYGKEKFNDNLSKKISYLDFLLNYFKYKYNLDNFEERKEFAITLLKYINDINSSFDKDYFISEIANLTKFSKQQLGSLLSPKKTIQVQRRVKKEDNGIITNRSEYSLLGQMLSGKEASLYIRDNLGFLPDQRLASLYLIINDYYYKFNELNEADLISYINQVDESLSDLFLDILNNDTIVKDYDIKIIDENINLIKVRLIDEDIKKLRRESLIDQSRQVEILNEITELYLQRSEILGK